MSCEERAAGRPYLATFPWPIPSLLRNHTKQQHWVGKKSQKNHCQPSLESLLSPPAQAPVPGVDKEENKRTHMSQAHKSSVCHTEGSTLNHHTALITCRVYSSPWLQLSPQHPYKSHHHCATELDFNLCQQQVYGAGWLGIAAFWFPRPLISIASCMTWGRGRIKGSFLPIFFHHGNKVCSKVGPALRSSCKLRNMVFVPVKSIKWARLESTRADFSWLILQPCLNYLGFLHFPCSYP